ncbi:hypothetical protein CDAR_294371 [Caerostris darwini]|uniref:Uncharacterized protein n=1 Tax=Caerostris darwini TaxID=1538125 RepID=A0AAV4UKK0_9ARAC|nr:hypothetical protein CDAR_294371 [Caerostris darwini]
MCSRILLKQILLADKELDEDDLVGVFNEANDLGEEPVAAKVIRERLELRRKVARMLNELFYFSEMSENESSMSNKHLSRFPLCLAGRHRSPKNDVIYKQACMKSHPTEREVRCRRRSRISLDAASWEEF